MDQDLMSSQIPQGVSPLPLQSDTQQGPAPCILQLVQHIAQQQGAGPLRIRTMMGARPQAYIAAGQT